MVKIKVKKLKEDAVIPCYARDGDAGMDVVATSCRIEKDFIEYGTGLSFELPKDYTMLIFPRSSVSKKNLVLANSVGVLDSGYRGELLVRFKYLGEKIDENEIYNVGERIAQIIVLPYPAINFIESSELNESVRGEGGFGSSGE